MRVCVGFGTRPEIVKLAPVVAALRAAGHEVRTVATGQHHDPELTDVFYDELGLWPDERWEIEGDEAGRVGAILTGAMRELAGRPADLVLLLGDTYTVPLFSLAARRHRVPVAHLEAGMRSFNPTSMEEVNRRVAAATASLHLAPTTLAARHLHAEGVPAERVRVVGNPVIDVLRTAGIPRRPPGGRRGVVVTAHRATNVDDPRRLADLAALVRRLAEELPPVRFPLHPRTRARLEAAGLLDELAGQPGLSLTPPVPYEHMLRLVAAARVVVTDSGGLQEEAAWLGVPVVVLRHSTPRWEGVDAGLAILTGLDAGRAFDAALSLAADAEQARVAAIPCPYGDGRTGERVAALLSDPETGALLRLDEPHLAPAEAGG